MNKKMIIALTVIIVLIVGEVFFLTRKNDNKEVLPTIYKITLDVNGRASVLETDENGVLQEPDEPYMPEGKFLGWYIGEEKVDFSKKFTSNTTIRAKWER